MAKLVTVALLVYLMTYGHSAEGAILVMNPNGGAFATKATLAAAAADADTAGKTVVVTSALSAVQSNISSATVHSWPADRALKVEKGGSLGNTTVFHFAEGGSFSAGNFQAFSGAGRVTGMRFAIPEWFGATSGGVHDDGPACRLAIAAIKDAGGELFFPNEKYRIAGATAGADGIKNGILIPWSGDFYGARKAILLRGRSEGTTLLAGESGMAVIRVSNPHTKIENISIEGGITGGASYTKYPTYPSPALTGVYGVLIGPEDITDTATTISTNHFKMADGTVSWCTEGIFFKCGPAASGSYLQTMERLHLTDNTRGLGFALPADVASVKNLTTSARLNNSYIAGGNVGIDATGVAGLKIVNSYIENVNSGTSPRATPTGVYIHNLMGDGFSYGHNVQFINTEIEQPTGGAIPVDNSDFTTSFVNSNYNRATSVGENLLSVFNKNATESSGRQVQFRLMDAVNGVVLMEVSNKPDASSGGLFTTNDIYFGGASAGITFDSTTANASISYNSNGVVNINADPNNLASSSIINLNVDGVTTAKVYGNVGGGYGNVAATAMAISKDGGTNRSINAAGTINASGADYAEYMLRSQSISGTIRKGDVVGLDSDGLVTNNFAESVSFMVVSTNPAYLGGDIWNPGDPVEQIAFSGQVPVNVPGAMVGSYIIPVNQNGKVAGQSVSNPTYEQYRSSVGRVIKIKNNTPIMIVKTP